MLKVNIKENETIALTIVEAIAEIQSIDPLDVNPLFDSINPDALNDMFRDNGGITVAFRHDNCDVVVGNGQVIVHGD